MDDWHSGVYFKTYPCEDNTKCEPIPLTLEKGIYKFELWGARSGTDYYLIPPAKGAYVSGILAIQKRFTFQIYLGGVGSDSRTSPTAYGGFNGGGTGKACGSGGGGASDVRLTASLSSRIIVAGGAGGGEWAQTGHGGGLEGISGQYIGCGKYTIAAGSTGGNQTQGGKGGFDVNHGLGQSGRFGYGGNGFSDRDSAAGGGGGYFGGGGITYVCSASGGSSYISGYEGCWSVPNETAEVTINESVHYSGFKFTEGKMIPGNNTMPLPSLRYEEGIGNDGPGAIRITLLWPLSTFWKRVFNLKIILPLTLTNSVIQS